MSVEFSSPLTRSDVVRAVLRVQLWVSVVHFGQSLVSALSMMSLISSGPNFKFSLFYGPEVSVVSIFLLLLFPALLAANALGGTERDLVSSWDNVRPLIGRCVGLWLFVQSLGGAVLTVGNLVYDAMTRSGNSIFSASGPGAWFQVLRPLQLIFVFLLGFFLAFGPTIRDNFRSH